MKRKIFCLTVFFLVFGVFSCSGPWEEENVEVLMNVDNSQRNYLNAETINFKNDLVQMFYQSRSKTKAEELDLSKAQLEEMRKETLKMLKSHGFVENDFSEFMSEGDPRLILFGVMFTAVLETNMVSAPRIKTRSEGDDGTCYDIAQVVVCASRAILSALGADVIQSFFSGYRCLTKTLIKDLFKGLLKKVPWVAAVVAIDTFIDCMGWYPW